MPRGLLSTDPPRSFAEHRGGGPISDRVTLLADVAEIVAGSHDLDETLGNVVDLVAKRLDADACSIYLIDSSLESLTLRATIGLERMSVGQVQLPVGEGLVGLAAQRRAPVVIECAEAHPRYKYFPATGEERFTSLMAVPLMVRDSTVGVLVVQTREPRSFDKREVETFQTCAQLIAPVIVNAQLISIVGQSEEQWLPSYEGLSLHGIRLAGRAPARPSRNALFRGRSAVRGIAIGPVLHVGNPLDISHVDYVPNEDPAAEEQSLLNALAEARRSLDESRNDLGDRFGPDFSAVLNTHVQILEDKGFVSKLREAVANTGNAHEALRNVIAAYRETFSRIEDPYFRDRILDIEDVGQRVMEHLQGEHQSPALTEGSIIITDNILPSLFGRLEIDKISAIVSEHGSASSHGAIFARTLEIPTVTGVAGIQAASVLGELAIVDGGEGVVHLAPDETLVAEYERARKQSDIAISHLDALRDRPAETRDGHRVSLTANCGLVSDLRFIDQHGAEGVGLFRTEMLAIAHRGFPEEDEQEQLYERVAKFLAPRPLTIRTLDLGGDKEIPNLGVRHEDNPQLGRRSIRLSLARVDSFRAQLRAILRASAVRNVRLLLPMISALEELRAARSIIAETKEQLRLAGTDFDAKVPIGVMIEVPSAALISDVLARECDFFSIGTNDLTQYTLAVDRGNDHVAHLYDPLHPAVLHLIDVSARSARRARIPVSLCGELATNPLAVPILIGLGITELSGTPSAVPMVKEIVHALSTGDAQQDARAALQAASASEVHLIGASRLEQAGLLEHPDLGVWLSSIARPVLNARAR